MAFDGNGNWVSDFSAVADRDANIKILASRFDGIFIEDIAESFENCLTKDMQVKPQQSFDANNYKVINVADPTNNNDAVNLQTHNSDIHKAETKIGMVIPFAGSTAPDGWLICDGTAISRSTYNDLFDVIGTTYGSGDGITTFNVPKLSFDRYLLDSYSDGTDWYKVYSDGWVEQGGKTDVSENHKVIEFLKPFSDTNYSVIVGNANTSANTGGVTVSSLASDLKTTGFQVSQLNQSQRYTMWRAYGYGADPAIVTSLVYVIKY